MNEAEFAPNPRIFARCVPVNPDNCRRQGNPLIDRARQPQFCLRRRIRMIFFRRLPVKRLKPRGGSPRFRAIILSGKVGEPAETRTREEERAR